MRIEVHIEELILEGFAPGDRLRISAAVQQGLTRLFETRGIPADWIARGQVESLVGELGTMAPGARPEAQGVRLAEGIYGGKAEQ